VRNLSYLLAIALAVGALVLIVPSDQSTPTETITPATSRSSLPTPEGPPKLSAIETTITQSNDDQTTTLRGYVQSNETGSGVEGATVNVFWGEADASREVEKTTDAEGGFAVSAPIAGDYRIEVSHPILVSKERRYTATVAESNPPSDIVIWMKRAGVISGRVFDVQSNEGIVGVKVGLNRKQEPGTSTDADGRYRIEGVRDGKRRIFLGHARGYIDSPSKSNGVQVNVSPEEEVVNVDFSLQPGMYAAIEGKVLDERGNPVIGAEVRAVSYNSSTRDSQSGSDTTTADGTFQIAELRVAGGFFVTAKSNGFVSESLGPLGLTVDGIQDAVLTLRPTGSISGQVVDVNSGRPVGETEFVVGIRYLSMGRYFGGGSSDHLNEDGKFELVELPPGSYGLIIDSDPNVSTTAMPRPQISVDLEHGQDLTDVVLTFDHERYLQSKVARKTRTRKSDRRGRPTRPQVEEVRGRVVHAMNGDAVVAFNMKIANGNRHSLRSVHDRDGRFVIQKETGDRLAIGFSARGYAPNDEVVSGDAAHQPVHDITVRLQPGAVVEGKVVDSSRNAVAGAEIHIGVDPSLHVSRPLGRPSDAVSGPDGSFKLNTLSAAKTRIYATHPTFAAGSAEVSASTSRATRLEIVLDEGGAIAGYVRRVGVALAGQNIFVRNNANEYVRLSESRTDAHGSFRFNHLPPGDYELHTGIDNPSRSLHIDAVVVKGKVTEVNFEFDDPVNVLQGTVFMDTPQSSSASTRR